MIGTTPPLDITEAGVGHLHVFPLPTDEGTLLAVLTDVFERWWTSIRYGPIIQGAVFEGRATRKPTMSMLDGYLTIDAGPWHAHLCIGAHEGHPGPGVEPDVARARRCSRAELYRLLHEGAPVSWGLRLFNGLGDQQITVLLPNPFLDDDQRVLTPPDWTRLACWDHLRRTYLHLPADPIDRSGSAFHHV